MNSYLEKLIKRINSVDCMLFTHEGVYCLGTGTCSNNPRYVLHCGKGEHDFRFVESLENIVSEELKDEQFEQTYISEEIDNFLLDLLGKRKLSFEDVKEKLKERIIYIFKLPSLIISKFLIPLTNTTNTNVDEGRIYVIKIKNLSWAKEKIRLGKYGGVERIGEVFINYARAKKQLCDKKLHPLLENLKRHGKCEISISELPPQKREKVEEGYEVLGIKKFNGSFYLVTRLPERKEQSITGEFIQKSSVEAGIKLPIFNKELRRVFTPTLYIFSRTYKHPALDPDSDKFPKPACLGLLSQRRLEDIRWRRAEEFIDALFSLCTIFCSGLRVNPYFKE